MENSPNTTTTTASNSPEFEFNTSTQQTTLHSADQLFSGGILLPLRLLNTDDPPDIAPESTITNTPPDTTDGSDLKTLSKRWKHIFKKNPSETKDPDKKKKKERSAAAGTGTAELNINLWPFSRSRSAGTMSSRPRTVAGNRKVSSAPCSRSNSTGRKWPSSPSRGGVHLGRSSPVWQAKRFGQSRSLHDSLVRSTAEKSSRPTKTPTTGAGAGAEAKGKKLNLSVPTCIGYRQRMSCQSDVSKGGCVAGGKAEVTPVNGGGGGLGGGGGSLFNLRSLFTKKVF